VQDADSWPLVAQRRGTQPRDKSLVVTAGGVEKPATHRVEHRRQRVEHLLHPREATERPEQADGLAGRLRRLDEGRDELEGLACDREQPIPQEVELLRPRERLGGT